MQLTFLGTSCMVPTKKRNVSGLFLKYKTEGILFDCGEGTQRQMNICGIKRTKVTKILISHWHGDHVSGIIGLIQTIGNNENPPIIKIYGPLGTKEKMDHLLNSCIFDQRVDIRINEIDPKDKLKKIYEDDDYYIETAALSHKVQCIGYSFIEKDKIRINKAFLKKHNIPEGPHLKKLQAGKDIKIKGNEIKAKDATYIVSGKKITYIADTVPCKGILLLAENADIMISEASYSSALENKAEQYYHMTAKQAALMASQSLAKQLILTHFSQRYNNTQEIEEDARDVFDNVICAEDFMRISL